MLIILFSYFNVGFNPVDLKTSVSRMTELDYFSFSFTPWKSGSE